MKTWCIYIVEYYSAIKEKEILSYAGKWMDLQKMILSEVTQTQKNKRHMFPLIWSSKIQIFRLIYNLK